MRAMLAIAACVLAFVAPAGAQPAAPQAEIAQSGAQVLGTRWEGRATWSDGESNFWWVEFRPGGILLYGYNGATYDNGRWTQNDSLITWHTNNYFALYAGTITGGTMGGTMYNRRGLRGSWSFERTL